MRPINRIHVRASGHARIRSLSCSLALALVPLAVGLDAPAASSRAPAGELKVDWGCFQQAEEEAQGSLGSVGRQSGGGGGRGYGAAPAPKKSGKGQASAPPMNVAPAGAAAPPPPPAPEPVALEESGADLAPSTSADGVATLDDLSSTSRTEDAKAERAAGESDRSVPAEHTVARRVLDWGATIFLSNDDSMSLASAQRLLYAVTQGVGFSASQVRPHELLNYFSFDTSTPSDEQLFDVLASAEQSGDTLEVALAVKGAVPPRDPLDLTLVIDRSCSMEDEGRMDYTKRGLHRMREQLHDGDRIDIVLFDDAICTPLENFVVGRDDEKVLRDVVDAMVPRGATDLDLGLKEGYAVAHRKADTHQRNRRMMVITDAMLNTGDVDPNTVSEIGKAYESDAIRLTGVGVGREFNDEVLDRLTEKGKGAYVYLGSEAVVDRVFGVGFDSLTRTIAHDVQFSLDLPDSLAMARFYGEEASTDARDVQPINYYAGTAQVFLQDLTMRDGKVVSKDPVVLTITYRDARSGEPEKRVFRTTVGEMLAADPHNVRKAKALMAWSDLLSAQAMGGEPCGEPLTAYGRAASRVGGDAEITFVNGLVRNTCSGFVVPRFVPEVARVSYKVKVDSDIPIAEVGLSCQGERWNEPISGSNTVARFEAVPGACTLTLTGAVAMTAEVDVPATGGDVRCLVRGGRVSCS